MGKATRWIKGLLGMKKDKENVEIDSNYGDKKEKKRWSFVKSARESSSSALKEIPVAKDNSSWLRSFMAESENEKSKHAIAVAAATAAAADAAVAAAHAAVAVVRLTSQGRGGLFVGAREKLAAVKIQTVFRGYLARKALRALKGLVKLQALVRGYLVRKRAAATLHSMQALFRAQAAIRARRSTRNDRRFHPESRAQRSIETRNDLFHSKRLSASYDPCYNSFEGSPKIVEIDTCGASKSGSRRISNACVPENFDDQYYHMTSSPLPCPKPSSHLRIPNLHHTRDYDWGFIEEDYKFSTAQSTPRFAFTSRGNNNNNNVLPITPSKSVCGDSFLSGYYGNCPSYMANTQSFNAKLRSHSAPKQRPEPVGPKKRLSLTEIMAARSSFSGVRMQRRSCSQVHEDFEL